MIDDALAALDHYVTHRQERLDQVRAALEQLANAPHPEGLAEDELPRRVVEIVYTRFFSAGSQRVTRTQLLPLEAGPITEGREEEGPHAVYEFEPSPEGILELLLPRYVEARIFAAMHDAAASEQAARQRAMKSATDNAEELIRVLGVQANKLRQAGITTEIMEIVGGAEALRPSA